MHFHTSTVGDTDLDENLYGVSFDVQRKTIVYFVSRKNTIVATITNKKETKIYFVQNPLCQSRLYLAVFSFWLYMKDVNNLHEYLLNSYELWEGDVHIFWIMCLIHHHHCHISCRTSTAAHRPYTYSESAAICLYLLRVEITVIWNTYDGKQKISIRHLNSKWMFQRNQFY